MKAILFDGKLKFEENHPEPEPARDEALIRVRLAGICNTDLEITRGYMGFRGITFRTKFLPNEQGEHFKINLYDHGCGRRGRRTTTATATTTSTSATSSGPNALYHNDGNGRFTDVDGRRRASRSPTASRVAAVFADFDGDGRRGPLRHDDARRQRAVPQPGRRHVRGRRRQKRGPDARGALPDRRRSSTPTATATSTSS